MGLDEYRRKRDFARSREPRGQQAAPGHGRLYVVQKHAARRLHYDLRLEMDGVLKSWAVPKGPSLDPREKRLAVLVEDHPLEYGAFEGTIPPGEYGAGTVMLWDRGTWEPEGDPAQDFPRGKLSFRLHGEKLRGSWALVQMRDRDGGASKNWLLIKHQDGEAVAEERYAVVAERPDSVLSNRSLPEIAAAYDGPHRDVVSGPAEPDPARLTNARPGRLPREIKPQLAALVAEPPAGPQWLHEIKLDGYRILARIRNGEVRLLTRQGRDWTAKFPAIAEALRAMPTVQALLDGEICVLRPDGTTDFQALQDLLRRGGQETVVYYLFDLPFCNGYDLTRTPLQERKNLLRSLLARTAPPNDRLRYSDHIRGGGAEVLRQACLLTAEGIVSKKGDSAYASQRSRNWLKSKCGRRQEMVIGGWSEPGGSRPGFGALLLGYYRDKELRYAGRVGSGFSQAALRDLGRRLRQLETPAPPFANPPTGTAARGVHWVRPELVAEVAFREWTRENLLRQAVFLGLRADKSPGEVIREAAAANSAEAAGRAEPSRPGRAAAAAQVAGIKLSHPDRLLYPGQNIRKQDLAEFYATIGDFILPHLRHRPLTLLRCPEGRQAQCFYQKHLRESLPEALRTIPIVEKGGSAEYIVVDDLKGLISLVQMGVLEIHPWGSSEADLERPDILTFDLDPGPEVGWPEVIAGARLLRDRLFALGLKSFVKTSGGKGLHLQVPILPQLGWEEAKVFSGAVARDLARQLPDRFTAGPRKATRAGRIFIDYLRNDRGATTVAAYSTRAAAGAPVSTPIRWDELDRAMTPDRYRLDNLPRRLAALKENPWPDFFTLRQEIPGAKGLRS